MVRAKMGAHPRTQTRDESISHMHAHIYICVGRYVLPHTVIHSHTHENSYTHEHSYTHMLTHARTRTHTHALINSLTVH